MFPDKADGPGGTVPAMSQGRAGTAEQECKAHGRADQSVRLTGLPRMGLLVIVVTRLNGGQFGVNPDLIQRIDSAPDTILTLIDGTKYIVAEPMSEVIALVHEYRATILARARVLADELDQVEADGPPDTDDDRPIAPAVPLRPRGL